MSLSQPPNEDLTINSSQKKVLPRKLLPKPEEEEEKKEGRGTKTDGQNQREFMAFLFAGAETRGKG